MADQWEETSLNERTYKASSDGLAALTLLTSHHTREFAEDLGKLLVGRLTG